MLRAVKILASVFFVLFALVVVAYAEDFKDSLKEANRVFMDAVSRHDAIAIAGIYHKDAKVLPPNSDFVNGREAIEAFWRSTLTPSVTGFVLNTEDTEKEDDLAVETGTYEVKGPENATLDKGKHVVVWKKDDGKWLVYRDIWNSSVAAPPATAATQ